MAIWYVHSSITSFKSMDTNGVSTEQREDEGSGTAVD
jgi:hypothetical protein